MRVNVKNMELVMEREGIRTLPELAERLALDKSTVSRVMKGDARPGPRLIEALKAAFPMYSLEFFLDFEGGDGGGD